MAIILNTRENLYCLASIIALGFSTIFMVVSIGKFVCGTNDWIAGGTSIRNRHEFLSCYAQCVAVAIFLN